MINIKADTFLFNEGDNGNLFYFVNHGELELRVDNKPVRKYYRGDAFGELSLIQNDKRKQSVISLSDSSLFCLSGQIYREIIEDINSAELGEKIGLLRKIPFFGI